MPPARRRPRSYDPVKVRSAVLAQFGYARDGVLSLTDEQLAAPAGVGRWTVRELAAHLAMVVESVSRGLDAPAPQRREVALPDWALTIAERSAQADDEGLAVRARADAESLDVLYERAAARLVERLAEARDDRLLSTPAGAMTLADHLVTRTVELVVHTDDLNRATGLAVPCDRQALAACTRLLADALAVKAPGASTEVRVPPFAVVQCVEGPRHTRGTPPNVVETDPLTWVRLATGRARWATEVAEARVSASGERADLSGLLPVMR